jgi:hypothetical protein
VTRPTIEALGDLVALLDRDEAYDADPQGGPPIRTASYRAALRAALLVCPHGPVASSGVGPEASDAYRAGQADALDAVIRAIAGGLAGPS